MQEREQGQELEVGEQERARRRRTEQRRQEEKKKQEGGAETKRQDYYYLVDRDRSLKSFCPRLLRQSLGFKSFSF